MQLKYIFGVLAFSAVSGVLEIMMRMILWCDGGWQRNPRGFAGSCIVKLRIVRDQSIVFPYSETIQPVECVKWQICKVGKSGEVHTESSFLHLMPLFTSWCDKLSGSRISQEKRIQDPNPNFINRMSQTHFYGMSELQNASRLVRFQILVRVAHRIRDVLRRETQS